MAGESRHLRPLGKTEGMIKGIEHAAIAAKDIAQTYAVSEAKAFRRIAAILAHYAE